MHDVIVIGAGAAGLVAAARAAAGGAKTLVLEKNRKAGVKILMSGGTRCNLTHDCDAAGIMEAFGRSGRFLRQALAALGPRETVAMFHELGVRTKVEATGKVFPASDRAVEVRDALVRQAIQAGADLKLGAGVHAIEPRDDGFDVFVDGGPLRASRVIVTSGGRSWPGCGTTGDGYGWLERLGHTIRPTFPALVPLVGGEPWMRELSGLTLDRVALQVWNRSADGGRRGKKPEQSRTGGFLFTHQGFSGPAVMDVSRALTGGGAFQSAELVADWLPETPADQLEQWIEEKRRSHGGQRLAASLTEWVPRRLAEGVAGAIDAGDVRWGELPKKTRAVLVESLKRMTLPVTGSRGFEKAEVTAGGVDLAEVDPRTMASRRVPGLYIAGEILDLDGWIGGYNFQSAFSTGHVAGTHAARL